MADQRSLHRIALSRVQGARFLIDNKDWDGAAQMMGLALECALKSAVCKTLRLGTYPDAQDHKDKKVPDFFRTHSFDRLLLISGSSDLFKVSGDLDAFRNWSTFVSSYPGGDWVGSRYEEVFDEATVRSLFKALFEDSKSILRMMTNKQRW